MQFSYALSLIEQDDSELKQVQQNINSIQYNQKDFQDLIQLLIVNINLKRCLKLSVLMHLFNKFSQYSVIDTQMQSIIQQYVIINKRSTFYKISGLNENINVEVFTTLLYLYPDINYLAYSIKSQSEPSIKIVLDIISHYMHSNDLAQSFINLNFGGKQVSDNDIKQYIQFMNNFKASIEVSQSRNVIMQTQQFEFLLSNIINALTDRQRDNVTIQQQILNYTALHCIVQYSNVTLKKYFLSKILSLNVLSISKNNIQYALSQCFGIEEFISYSLLYFVQNISICELPKYQQTQQLLEQVNTARQVLDKNDKNVYFMKQYGEEGISDDMLTNFSTQVHQLNSALLHAVKNECEQQENNKDYWVFMDQTHLFYYILQRFFSNFRPETYHRIYLPEQYSLNEIVILVLLKQRNSEQQLSNIKQLILKLPLYGRLELYQFMFDNNIINQQEYNVLTEPVLDKVNLQGDKLVSKFQQLLTQQCILPEAQELINTFTLNYQSLLPLLDQLELENQRVTIRNQEYNMESINAIYKLQFHQFLLHLLCTVPEDHSSKKISMYNIFFSLLTDKPKQIEILIKAKLLQVLTSILMLQYLPINNILDASTNIVLDKQQPFFLQIYEKNKNVFNYNSTKYKRMAQYYLYLRYMLFQVKQLNNSTVGQSLTNMFNSLVQSINDSSIVRGTRQLLEQNIALLILIMSKEQKDKVIAIVTNMKQILGNSNQMSTQSQLMIQCIVQQYMFESKEFMIQMVIQELTEDLIRNLLSYNNQLRFISKVFLSQNKQYYENIIDKTILQVVSQEMEEQQQKLSLEISQLFNKLSLKKLENTKEDLFQSIYAVQTDFVIPFSKLSTEVIKTGNDAVSLLNDQNQIQKLIKSIFKNYDLNYSMFNQQLINKRDLNDEIKIFNSLIYNDQYVNYTTVNNTSAIQQEKTVDNITQRKIDGKHDDVYADLIIVTSLLDTTVNIGGICRTAEVFSCKQLVVKDIDIKNNPVFISQAVTAEKHLDMLQVGIEELEKYLYSMQDQGYKLVCLEQSTRSIYLQDAQLPEKMILLLGNEAQGVPNKYLQMADMCVEIPQSGMIRSLNVHTSASIMIWEYIKQQRYQQKENNLQQ